MKNSLQNVQARQRQILERLQPGELLFVRDLSQDLQVSEVTIRRDLQALEKAGLVERVFGGARLLAPEKPEEAPEPPLPDVMHALYSRSLLARQARHGAEKDRICKRVAALLENDEIVFMNSGTTLLYLMQYVANKHLHIFTNNAALALVERPPDVELTITGGEHYVRTQSMVGSSTSAAYSTG